MEEGRTKALPVAQMAAATTGRRSFMVARRAKMTSPAGEDLALRQKTDMCVRTFSKST